MTLHTPPNRISDLVSLKQNGLSVTCQTYFEIVPLEIDDSGNSVRAFIFLCRYGGTIDGKAYGFRKCYARACSDQHCANMYQAVMTAKPYAYADYDKLERAGIVLEKRRMTLEEIVKKFEGMQETYGPTQIIHDYIDMARQGHGVKIDPVLNIMSAQEYIDNYKIQRIFLMVVFGITCQGNTHQHERCFACYSKDQEAIEKKEKVTIANERLKILYNEFDNASIKCEKQFF
ncbi:MAG: hypothetical protein DRH90_18040 [Deltaproteobacteria bacterium]|nr:MAG: hypothetical protein DRH90_18040 [Deltaproteobacteria bacterium]RLC15338.1 MAG: hypothetical protein DRI24_11235 [Deltaproteobacteria bacterium]